ncbi:MAG: hypothetical protein JXR18_10615 [Neptuniibacter sp.]
MSMEDKIEIHGTLWKVTDIKDEVIWCRGECWTHSTFTPSDSVLHKKILTQAPKNSGSAVKVKLIKNGWEHEHCQICWWKIFVSEKQEVGTGYSNGKIWVCTECYEQFIEGNKLELSS